MLQNAIVLAFDRYFKTNKNLRFATLTYGIIRKLVYL